MDFVSFCFHHNQDIPISQVCQDTFIASDLLAEEERPPRGRWPHGGEVRREKRGSLIGYINCLSINGAAGCSMLNPQTCIEP